MFRGCAGGHAHVVALFLLAWTWEARGGSLRGSVEAEEARASALSDASRPDPGISGAEGPDPAEPSIWTLGPPVSFCLSTGFLLVPFPLSSMPPSSSSALGKPDTIEVFPRQTTSHLPGMLL